MTFNVLTKTNKTKNWGEIETVKTLEHRNMHEKNEESKLALDMRLLL